MLKLEIIEASKIQRLLFIGIELIYDLLKEDFIIKTPSCISIDLF